jgi:hypothetical protein
MVPIFGMPAGAMKTGHRIVKHADEAIAIVQGGTKRAHKLATDAGGNVVRHADETGQLGKGKSLQGPGASGSGATTGATSSPVNSNTSTGGPYGHLQDGPTVNSGKDFTQSQKKRILDENEAKNGGVLRDDKSGEPLVRPQQHRKGVTPPSNEAHVDHAYPKSQGGPNSYGNADVRSRANNLAKGDKIGDE